MGSYYRDFVADETQALGFTLEQVKGWTPPGQGEAGRRPEKGVTAACENLAPSLT